MPMPYLLRFLYSQFLVTPKYPTQSWEGKTVIVTGSNVGLGFEGAKHFVRLGAEKVIIAVRSLDKGKTAQELIERETKRTGVVEVWQLDLSSYDSVKAFAKRVDGLKRIDSIVENAGIATEKYAVAEENESTITVNVVSTFLLALLVLPALKRSAVEHKTTPTLVIVSSEVHFFTSFPERKAPAIFDHLSEKSSANMADRYNLSKLLEVFVVRELASKYMPRPTEPGNYPVVLNCLNPGLCHSELARDSGWGLWFLKQVLARSTEVGSRTLLASAAAGRESHGEYMSDGVVAPTAPLVGTEEGNRAQEQVWKELSAKLEAIQPGILQNI